ncbi:MAG: DNA polymerase III subunit delta [Clostridiales bacterium]|nr:DNA polymerase III subunit delta [Clostridiales bacterium]
MKYVDFKKFTDENGAQPIYLFEGEEAYFREKGEQLLKSRFLQEPTLDYVSYDGATLKGDGIQTLVDALQSFPFISEKRFVRVTEFYPSEKDYEAYLKPIFENPPQSGLLMIINAAKPKTGSVSLAKKPNITYVDCGKSDEETIKKWIYITCKREGIYADGVTSGKLAEYCNFDMSRISKETEKLLSYCKAENAERLTDEIVDMLVYPDMEYKIFELANAISRKNYSAFVRIADELMLKGFNEHSLLSSLAAYFRGIYETSLMRGDDKAVAIALGIKEYAARKNREQAAKFGKDEIYRLYNATYGAISDVKCGKMTPPAAFKWVTARLFFGKS